MDKWGAKGVSETAEISLKVQKSIGFGIFGQGPK